MNVPTKADFISFDGSVRRTTNIYRFGDAAKIRSLSVYMRSA